MTTSQSVEMIDKPSYGAFVKLEDQTTSPSFAPQGTMVLPVKHMTQARRRAANLTPTVRDHARKADWETLIARDLVLRLLKELLPKAANASGQDIRPPLLGTFVLLF